MNDYSVKKRLALLSVSLMLYAIPATVNAQQILTENVLEEQAYTDLTNVNIPFEQDLSWRLVCNTSAFYFSKDTAELNYYLQTVPLKFSFSGLSTFVHESLHHFEYVYGLHDAENVYYYIDSSTILPVPRYREKLMPAGVLKRYVGKAPDDFDKVYILNTKWNLADNGIYGLLSELSAFGQNCIFLDQIYPLLDTLDYVNDKGFRQSLQAEHENQVLAYYKFNLYIAQYLRAAKQSDTALYNYLVNNLTLREAYTAMDRRFREEILQSSNLLTKGAKNSNPAVLQGGMQPKYFIEKAKTAYNSSEIQQTLKDFAYGFDK